MKYVSFLLLYIFVSINANSQEKKITINSDWQFSKDTAVMDWTKIAIPHTWNAQDVMDDEPGYYRGDGYYKKRIFIDESWKPEQLFLLFEGVNQVADIYLNRKHIYQHKGGYTAFYVPLKNVLYGKFNEILIRANNSYNADIAPLSGDFTFYGGIYRDAYLVRKKQLYFSTKYASSGVYITTPAVSERSASVNIKSFLVNQSAKSNNILLSSILYDAEGKIVAKTEVKKSVSSGPETMIGQQIANIKNPRLWSPDDPYLYTVKTKIIERSTARVLDETVNPIGFRWYRFDADSGFYLNGKHLKLIGASRHQDFVNLGNALKDEYHTRDVQLLKEMGANFLRVAHYPQDPAVLQACDRLGLLASVEIPIVNEITPSADFRDNSIEMLKEMIHQNFNHPSIIVWCYMNEVLLKDKFEKGSAQKKAYHQQVRALAKQLDSVAKNQDPSRYTVIAHHADYEKYKNAGLLDVSDIVGWNLYSGWYGGDMNGFAWFLDHFRKENPDKILAVCEYGADADPRIRTDKPQRFDKSVEYATDFHKYYYEQMMKRPFVAAGMIWNLADFNSEGRIETMPHINNKGMTTWSRRPKDSYYYYQSVLSKKSYLKILPVKNTVAVEDSAGHAKRKVGIVTNLSGLKIFVNEQEVADLKNVESLSRVPVAFKDCTNKIVVKGKRGGMEYIDEAVIDFSVIPRQFRTQNNFKDLNILLGSERYYNQPSTGAIWIPDQPYIKGSFGSVGGKPFKIKGNTLLPYGTDKNIQQTFDDPIYQTQLQGIKEYRFDVPAGKYQIKLYFAELEGGSVKSLEYNLGNYSRIDSLHERVFDVAINENLFLSNFNIDKEFGSATAVTKKMEVYTTRGIVVKFTGRSGVPVLNAISLKKIF